MKVVLCLYGLAFSKVDKWCKEHGIDIPRDNSVFFPRHHPLLVQCVEELSKIEDNLGLYIETITGNVYRICINPEDGSEYIETPQDVIWNVAKENISLSLKEIKKEDCKRLCVSEYEEFNPNWCLNCKTVFNKRYVLEEIEND